MTSTPFIPLICAAALAISCNDTGPVQAPETARPEMYQLGKIVVFVHFGDQGVPDKRVEIVELHLEQRTDEEGLAEFFVPAGDYTLRAYDINGGGPALRHIDTKVTIERGEEERVEIFDCLPCN